MLRLDPFIHKPACLDQAETIGPQHAVHELLLTRPIPEKVGLLEGSRSRVKYLVNVDACEDSLG